MVGRRERREREEREEREPPDNKLGADKVVSLAVAPPIEAVIYSKEIFIPAI